MRSNGQVNLAETETQENLSLTLSDLYWDLVRLAAMRVGPQDAEDVVQIALVRVLGQEARPRCGHWAGWLLRAVDNAGKRYLENRYRETQRTAGVVLSLDEFAEYER